MGLGFRGGVEHGIGAGLVVRIWIGVEDYLRLARVGVKVRVEVGVSRVGVGAGVGVGG